MKRLGIVVFVFFTILALFWKPLTRQLGDFEPIGQGYKVHSALCLGCVIQFIQRNSQEANFTNELVVTDASGTIRESLFVEQFQVPISREMYDFSLSEFSKNAHDYVVSKRTNFGSGDGYFYQVFRVEEEKFVKLHVEDFLFACGDPTFVGQTTLRFKNLGSHCSFLDTPAYAPESKEVTL